jgi:hypothetical protein
MLARRVVRIQQIELLLESRQIDLVTCRFQAVSLVEKSMGHIVFGAPLSLSRVSRRLWGCDGGTLF